MKFYAIRENHLFVKAYKSGVKVVCPSLVLYVLPDKHAWLLRKQNPEKKLLNRIGITVSKKMGSAVQRSRGRRVLRAAFSQAENSGEMKKGYLIVLVAREKALHKKSTEIGRELCVALRKAGLLT
jgi:ribonuclease P protein component